MDYRQFSPHYKVFRLPPVRRLTSPIPSFVISFCFRFCNLFPGQGGGLGFSFSLSEPLGSYTRPCFEGVGGFILSTTIVVLELGGSSSREIA